MTNGYSESQILRLDRALIFLITTLTFKTLQVDSFSSGISTQYSQLLRRLFSPKQLESNCMSFSPYQSEIVGVGFNYRPTKRDIIKAVWRDSVVSLTIPASKERTYELFSSLNEHPTW